MGVYLVAEGPQDVAFLGRLLRWSGFQQYSSFSTLKQDQPVWSQLVPASFPARDHLLEPLSVPSFFIKGTLLVTLQSAGGFDRLASRLEETLAIVSLSAIAAIGLFPDADHYSPERRLQEIRRQVGGRVPGLILPDQAGTVGMGQPKAGVFVLPDNRSQGRLEDLLEDCARVVYPASLHAAADFVSYASANELTDEDQVELRRPAGELKARLGCVSALLKPGRTIQVSLQDNRWISEPALRLPRIQGINGFLDSLLQP